jgi:hypothetical protein
MLIEYIHNIYGSDINTSLDKNIYLKYNINIVINCSNDIGFLDIDIKKIRIPISNDLNIHTDIPLLIKNIDKILSYIYANFIDNTILICCSNGNNIGPLIICLFMIKYGNVSIKDVKNIIKSKNKNICIDYDLSVFNL